VRPTAFEILHGVRTLLAQDLLPEMTAPHLRSQVMLAVSMLDAAAAELNDAPAAYAEERARMIALAADALPLIRRIAPADPLIADLEAISAAPPEPPDRSLIAQAEESARLLGLLDRLSAACDEPDAGERGDLTALGERVDTELRAHIARRATWIGRGP
jgi:hypothetical protein